MNITPRRPILRYHGGKWLLAPWIISHFPQHRVYVEPYGGAASVLLRKARSYTEVYNEIDDEIFQLFKVTREQGERLAMSLELTPFSRREFQEAYKPTPDAIESSRRTIVRSFMGFGSDGVHSTHRTGFRGRSQRSGTTPAHDWAHFPDAFRLIIARLQAVVIECKPALEVIESYDSPETLHYVDPPYVHSTRKRVDAARGYRHEMTDSDHRDLARTLKRVRGGGSPQRISLGTLRRALCVLAARRKNRTVRRRRHEAHGGALVFSQDTNRPHTFVRPNA